ncbi:NUDIX hydrolase [Asanoa ishikariensis]|uniref:ADP-ribose pyrophosphatase YjhB, NUDIX family n=1 Tax=Asanoa ishikariensis TaxID=137265 RepID=A0A1H3RKP4_9ACTN|nr:NUDIX domain-containing protein [Asanoa ishikariensis]GIF67108.1 NUDIX hydrolase [Asanoa ishikariensis]SDZ26190.1 ADP-ribose pyrophosphatase YjhB, NUDIX family [Asanoa ishikariensis]
MASRDSHCSFCGAAYAQDQPWPRVCAACGQTTYRNPVPVAVAVLPVDDGVLVIRRAIPPRVGLLALPGGFVDHGESWQRAVTRELFEETGIVVAETDVSLFDVHSAPDGTVLIFGLLAATTAAALPASTPNAEVAGWQVAGDTTDLAFDLHARVLTRYLSDRISA